MGKNGAFNMELGKLVLAKKKVGKGVEEDFPIMNNVKRVRGEDYRIQRAKAKKRGDSSGGKDYVARLPLGQCLFTQ